MSPFRMSQNIQNINTIKSNRRGYELQSVERKRALYGVQVEVKRLMVIADTDHIYNKVRDALRQADPDKHITVFTMQPMQGGDYRQEILGYSLMAALGIKSEELNALS